MKTVNRILSWIDWFNDRSGRYFSFLVIPIALTLFFEVIMRYVFNSPTMWVHETSNYFFGALFVLGGAYTLRHKGHVNVEILHIRLPIKARAVVDIITSSIFYLMMGCVFWYGIILAALSVEVWEISHTVWGPPVWPIKIIVPVGALFILLQGTAKLIRDIQTLATGREVVVEEEVVSL